MKELNLFHELCETIFDHYGDVEISHYTTSISALRKLRDIVDDETINRCLKKLKKWRGNEI